MGHKIYLNFECQEVINTVTEMCVCVGGGGGGGGRGRVWGYGDNSSYLPPLAKLVTSLH